MLNQKIAIVSKKVNATRKRLNVIVMYKNYQFVFVDTPGIHEKERLLNKFMLEESMKAIGDCDLILFLLPITDSIKSYEDFLKLNTKKPHIVLLTKSDSVKNENILKKLIQFQPFMNCYQEIIPVSIKQASSKSYLLNQISKYIPEHPFLYDPEMLTTQMEKEIFKEFIREAIFEFTSDEIPYSSDVLIDKVEEGKELYKIFATVITEKESQKGIIIGKDGLCLKRIGKQARLSIETLTNKKIYLKLVVKVNKNWTKDESLLKKVGYLAVWVLLLTYLYDIIKSEI